jgi:hypothetical protein
VAEMYLPLPESIISQLNREGLIGVTAFPNLLQIS